MAIMDALCNDSRPCLVVLCKHPAWVCTVATAVPLLVGYTAPAGPLGMRPVVQGSVLLLLLLAFARCVRPLECGMRKGPAVQMPLHLLPLALVPCMDALLVLSMLTRPGCSSQLCLMTCIREGFLLQRFTMCGRVSLLELRSPASRVLVVRATAIHRACSTHSFTPFWRGRHCHSTVAGVLLLLLQLRVCSQALWWRRCLARSQVEPACSAKQQPNQREAAPATWLPWQGRSGCCAPHCAG